MKRNIRKMKFKASNNQTLPDFYSNRHYKPEVITESFLHFDKINKIEVQLDEEINSIEKLEDCTFMLNRIDLAKEMSVTLQESLKLELETFDPRAYGCSDRLVIKEFLQELHKMMFAINQIKSQVLKKMIQIKSNQPKDNFSLEKMILPSIEDYAVLVTVELKEQLLQNDIDQVKSDEILKRHALILKKTLYGDDDENQPKSIISQMHYAMKEHYFETLKQNQNLINVVNQYGQEKTGFLAQKRQLEHQLDKLKAENQNFQNNIQSTEIENKQIKMKLQNLETSQQQTSNQLESLSQENMSLQKQLNELTQKLSKLDMKPKDAHMNKETKQHHVPFLSFLNNR